MRKELKSEFSTRQYMHSKDFEVYYFSDKTILDVKQHSHDYYEFYFFLEGQVVMYIEDTAYAPKMGTMIVIPPHVHHHIRQIDSRLAYRRFVFWITKDFLETLGRISEDYKYLTDVTGNSPCFTHGFSDIEFNTIQGKLFTLIDEIHSDRFGKDAKILLDVSDFLLTVNRIVHESLNPTLNEPTSDTLYQSIIQYIENHIDEELSLDLIAEKLHVSKFHISHIFTETNGISIHKYITKKRLGMCKDAILSGEDISNVCLSYGFSDYSVFYRAFVKEYGKSPKKFRDEVLRQP